jgi:hypothetical protein
MKTTYHRHSIAKRRRRRVVYEDEEEPNLTWWIAASIVCSVIALVFIPILFGALAAVDGGVVFFRGNKEMGFALIVTAVAATVFGMLFGMIVWSAQYGYR